jgi:hypothetical protein
MPPAKHALGLDPRGGSGSPTRTCGNIRIYGAIAVPLKPIPRYWPRHHNREIVSVRRRKHCSVARCATDSVNGFCATPMVLPRQGDHTMTFASLDDVPPRLERIDSLSLVAMTPSHCARTIVRAPPGPVR